MTFSLAENIFRFKVSIFRVRTLLSYSISTTFQDFFHDLFTFYRTLGVAVSFKNSRNFLVLEYFLTLNSSTDTNSGIHQKCVCFALSTCIVTPLYLTLSLPCHLR